MGLGSERHDLTPTSSTTASGSASASRCCAPPASGSARRSPTPARSTPARSGRRTSSGSSCRGGSTPTARWASAGTSSRRSGPARSSASTSTTAGSSSTRCPGLPERAAAEGLTPLEYMRRYGAFEVRRGVGPVYEEPVPDDELDDVEVDASAACTPARPGPPASNIVPVAAPDRDAEGRRPVGVEVDGEVRRGLPTPIGPARVLLVDTGRLGLARARAARLHREPRPPRRTWPRARWSLISDLPPADPDPHPQRQRQVARRDRPHQPAVDPPQRRPRLGVGTGDLVRVETESATSWSRPG